MREVRPYQEHAIQAALDAYQRGVQRPMLVMPTGSGKNYMLNRVSQAVWHENKQKGIHKPNLHTAHREQLITQQAASAQSDIKGALVGIEMARQKSSPWHDIVCASIPTIQREHRLGWMEKNLPGLVVVDEAHHGSSEGYIKVARRFGGLDPGSGVKMLSLTATNYRLDKQELVDADGETIAQEVVAQVSLLDMIRQGYLKKIRPIKVVTQTDLTKVGRVGGDFNQGALAKEVNKRQRTEIALHHWEEHAGDRQTVVFCVDIEHAEQTAALFKEFGYRAACMHSANDPELNAQIDRDWKGGKLQIVCNVAMLTEGYDYPAISCVLMLRPTESWSLYNQMVGRGTRPYQDLDLILLDVVDITGVHDIMCAPKLIGYDKEADLTGMELTEADNLREEGVKSGGRPRKDGVYIHSDTKVIDVDLFKAYQSHPLVQKMSELAWHKNGKKFLLHIGRGEPTRKYPRGEPLTVTVERDVLGKWRMRLPGGTLRPELMGNGGSFPDFKKCDLAIQFTYPQKKFVDVYRQDAAWRTRPAGDPQRRHLISLNVSLDIIDQLSMGEAAALITTLTQK